MSEVEPSNLTQIPTAAGLKVSRYVLQEMVGRGAFGRVFAAHDPVLNRRLAVKIIPPDLDEQIRKEHLERFRVEAQVLGSLAHPNVVAVYDAGLEGAMPWVAMELCEGPSLEAVLTLHVTLTPAQAVWVAMQAAAGLDYVHREAIIHRDIKPANILFHRGQVKLTDFGLARTSEMSRMTTVGQVVGTPSYMSPEQVAGEELTPRSDLYSLGALVFHLLAGRPPFLGPPLVVMAQIANREPPLLSSVAPGIPPGLDAVIAAALVMDEDDRYASASEFCAAMLTVVSPDEVDQVGEDMEWLTNKNTSRPAPIRDAAASPTSDRPLARSKRLYSQTLNQRNRGVSADPPVSFGSDPREYLRRLGRTLAARRVIPAAAVFVVGGSAGWWFADPDYGWQESEASEPSYSDRNPSVSAIASGEASGVPKGPDSRSSGSVGREGSRPSVTDTAHGDSLGRPEVLDPTAEIYGLPPASASAPDPPPSGPVRDPILASLGPLDPSVTAIAPHLADLPGYNSPLPDVTGGKGKKKKVDPDEVVNIELWNSNKGGGSTHPAAAGRRSVYDPGASPGWPGPVASRSGGDGRGTSGIQDPSGVHPTVEIRKVAPKRNDEAATIEILMIPSTPGYVINPRWRQDGQGWVPALLRDFRGGRYLMEVIGAQGRVEIELQLVDPSGRVVRQTVKTVTIQPPA